MNKQKPFYRVVTVELKQAIGLKKDKPNLETVMNRLAAQGYLAVHFVDHDGAITVICESHIEVPKEVPPNGSNVPPTIPPEETETPDNVSTLPQPEILAAKASG